MKIGREKGIIAGHGTDRTDFTSFDVSHAAPYNVGLHFGTRAAALDRPAYLGRARTPSAPCTLAASARLLKFQSLGYDGLVYANEIEDGKSAADSYEVFDARQLTILGEETVPSRINPRAAA